MMENNLKFDFSISQSDRIKRLNQHPKVIWFTGLPCSGKSTLANALEIKLFNLGYQTYLLDGDNLRSGINKDLDFSIEDRKENLRRVAEIAKILIDAGILVIASFISPLRSGRLMIKNIIGHNYYFEIFVDTPIEECEKRDVKGLYKKAREKKIQNFTGVDMLYENPLNSILVLNNFRGNIDANINLITNAIFNIT